MCRVRDGAHGRSATLVVDVGNGLGSNVQHESIDQLDVVAVSRLIGHLEVQCICMQLFIKNKQLRVMKSSLCLDSAN